jgi:Icc-related predicted phosphoesterase
VHILLVSDLHYTLPQFDWVVEASGGFDLVVLAGDLLDISSVVPLDVQAFVVTRYVEAIAARTSVVVSSGNHDLTGLDEHGENAALWMSNLSEFGAVVDGESATFDSVLVTVCPWWDGPIGRARVANQLAADESRRPGTWVWVYHWPPAGSTTSWTGKRHYGDADLPLWLQQHRPDIVMTGHVHQPPFRPDGSWIDRVGGSWVLNPGRQIGPVPTSIEIDLTARTARWTSMLGEELAELGASEAPPRHVV